MSSRYDDFDHMTQELEMERKYRKGVEDSNIDSEKNVSELEGYLRHLDDQCQIVDENEWKIRYESQTVLNIHLSDEKNWLEEELAETRWKCHTGEYPDAMHFNLDLLTELELVRLVKHMERMRVDSYTTLREAEYKIDKENKEFRDLDEMRRTFQADLKHAKQAVERNEREKMLERKAGAATPPIYSREYTEWLDKQPLEGSQDPEAANKDGEGTKKEEPDDKAGTEAGEAGTGEGTSGAGEKTAEEGAAGGSDKAEGGK